MKKCLRVSAALVVSLGVLVLTWYLSYLVTRTAWVPAPIRAYYSNSEAFSRQVAAIRRDGPKAGRVTTELASYGVRYIGLESDCVVFIFAGMPPDAIEVLGCPLQHSRHPSGIITDFNNRNTYSFVMLNNEWFYWQYDLEAKQGRLTGKW
jgi:hypothetical protein